MAITFAVIIGFELLCRLDAGLYRNPGADTRDHLTDQGGVYHLIGHLLWPRYSSYRHPDHLIGDRGQLWRRQCREHQKFPIG